jgi:hypothetical protein
VISDTLRLYADEAFYRGRPEPEEMLTAVLIERRQPLGPANRPMRFALVGDYGELPAYAVGVAEERLTRFLGSRVVACGKRIDLRAEGFGVEFWIGEIRTQ